MTKVNQWGYMELFLHKRLFSSPLCFIWPLSELLNLVGCQCDKSVNFRNNVKDLLLRNLEGMNLILCIHRIDISLYINCVFIPI